MPQLNPPNKTSPYFLNGGGEMGELTRNYNWASSTLGEPDTWPQVLKNTLSILLRSKFPMFLWWGKGLIQFYNDAYRPSLGIEGKHPSALGQRGEDCWQEIWHVINPLIQKVLTDGEGTWNEDQLIPIYRNNRMEDVYWTFSYSAVINEQAQAVGVLVICNETTRYVQSYREMTEAKNELEFAVEAAELATYDLNPVTNKFIGNERLKNWFGFSSDVEIDLSTAINTIVADDRIRVTTALERALQFESGGMFTIDFKIVHPQTLVPRYVRAKAKALFNEMEQATRFSGTLQDITEEKTAAQRVKQGRENLQRAYEQIRLSKEAAQLGTFDLDVVNGTMEWDARCRELFGISHQGDVTYEEDFLPGLHPDDRERISKIIDNLFMRTISNGDYDVEYRTVGRDDEKVRWVRAKGKVFFNDKDVPVRFIGSVLDISDNKRDDERKNDFIGMVSHELKTPLTSLKAYVQMLEQVIKQEGDGFKINVLEKATRQLNKMSVMINGFLNIARFESGKIHLDMEEFLLDELITEIMEENASLVTTHQVTLKPCGPLKVFADKNKIGNVLSNLLNNAVKYSPAGKLIEVTCEVKGDNAQVSVKDEGIGIKPADIEHLFDRFYRVQNNETKNIAGFGIGLYLSAEIVERHSGHIWVESLFGKSATFYFTLPLA